MADNKVKISFEIDGIQKEVSSVEELTSEIEKLGKESKKTAKETKQLASEQGFIAEKVDGLKKTFRGLKGDFKNAKAGISAFFKSGTTGAKALKIGLASLGIPLLIGAVVSLINYFKNFEVVTRTIQKAMNALGAIVANVGKAFKLLISGDFSGAFNVMKNAVVEAVEATDDLFDSAKKLNEIQIRNATQNAKLRQEMEGYKKILEDTTASEKDRLAALDEVTKRTKLLAEAQLEENQAAIDGLEAQIKLENNEVARRDLQLELAQLRADRIDQQTELNNIEFDAAKVGREIVQQRLDQEEAAAEKRKQIREKEAAEKKALEEREAAEKKAAADKAAAEEVERKKTLTQALNEADTEAILLQLETDQERLYKQLELDQAAKLAELTQLKASEEDKAKITKLYALKKQKLDDEVAKHKQAVTKAENDAVVDIAAAGFGAIAQLAGESSAIGKAAAVSATIINTYKGAQSAFADTPGGIIIKSIAAGIAVTGGLLNVKKILSTKTPGGGSARAGGGGALPTAPSIPTGPQFNPQAALSAANEGQQLDNEVTVEQTGTQSTVVKAYVVSSDMTEQQDKDKKINELARL